MPKTKRPPPITTDDLRKNVDRLKRELKDAETKLERCSRGMTPDQRLWYAVQSQFPEDDKALEAIAEGAKLIKGAREAHFYQAAFRRAATQENIPMIRGLFKAGLREEDDHPWLCHNPMSAAVTKVLLELGCDVHGRDLYEWEPLTRCACENSPTSIEVAKLLIDAGGDPNLGGYKNSDGNTVPTPLVCAAKGGNQAMVNVLLEAGADPTVEIDGRTALDHALGQYTRNKEVFRLLFAAEE